MRIRMAVMAVAMAVLLVGAQGADAETVAVYSSLPLLGDAKPQSEDIVRAMKLAVADNGGVAGSFDIEYVSLDDASPKTRFWDPRQVKRNARLVAHDESAVAYLGELNSPASAVSVPILNEAGLLQISPSNTSVGLTRSGGAMPGEPGIYYPTGERTYGRVVPADHLQAAAQASLMAAERCTKVYVVADDEPYGQGISGLVLRKVAERGLETRRGPTIGQDFDAFRRLRRKVAASGADCFFFGGYTFFHAPEVFNVVGRAKRHLQFFGADAMAESGFATELRRGVSKRTWVSRPVPRQARISRRRARVLRRLQGQIRPFPRAVRHLRLRGDGRGARLHCAGRRRRGAHRRGP